MAGYGSWPTSVGRAEGPCRGSWCQGAANQREVTAPRSQQVTVQDHVNSCGSGKVGLRAGRGIGIGIAVRIGRLSMAGSIVSAVFVCAWETRGTRLYSLIQAISWLTPCFSRGEYDFYCRRYGWGRCSVEQWQPARRRHGVHGYSLSRIDDSWTANLVHVVTPAGDTEVHFHDPQSAWQRGPCRNADRFRPSFRQGRGRERALRLGLSPFRRTMGHWPSCA